MSPRSKSKLILKSCCKEIERLLKNAGSSMEKVLKVTVFLNDLKD